MSLRRLAEHPCPRWGDDCTAKPRTCAVTHGCKAPACREAERAYQRHRYLRGCYGTQAPPEHVHGTKAGYYVYGCKCSPCRDAARSYYLGRDRAAYMRAWRGARSPSDAIEGSRCLTIEDIMEEVKSAH